MHWQWPLLAALAGYLIGSIPFGLLLTRVAGAGDIRQIGSGNIGATNVLRTGRKGLAAATLLLDAAKGAFAVWLGARMMPEGGAALAGVTALVGHCYPVWLRFAGGKGVATMLGVVAALAWPLGLFFALMWLGMLAATRISSMGGMSAAASVPMAALLVGRWDVVIAAAGMALIVLWRHRANIDRLMRGEEPKVGSRKPDDSAHG